MAHCETGEIASLDHFRRTLSNEEFDRAVMPAAFLSDHARQSFERTGRAKLGRNDICPCGSRKKFKHCCMSIPRAVERKEESLIVAPW
jgi:uncharacterized protein YecA (UPF0149 family)